MSLTAYEKETILRWCEDVTEPLTIYTHSKSKAQKLISKGAKLIREAKHNGKPVSWTLEAPREWFRWPTPKAGAKGIAKAKQDAKRASGAHLQEPSREEAEARKG